MSDTPKTDTPRTDALELEMDGFSLGDAGSLFVELARELAEARKDAARYRLLRRGQHWSVINGIGDTLRAGELDATIDAAMAADPPAG